ncbi:MAG: hypothetical protein FGM33_01415 [Candidatus Kapabacteria bacterium]|nr:hypothetical protein [Candidatus Kapabacteria bacterium]
MMQLRIRLTVFVLAMTLILANNSGSAGGSPRPHGGVRFDPPTLVVTRDSTGFVQSMVRVYSDHGDSIRVMGVSGSCGCASASVQRPLMHDTTPAKIYVMIDARHFKDSINTVQYTVNHSGSSRPAMFNVSVRCKP